MPPAPRLHLITARRLSPLLQHLVQVMAAAPIPPRETETIVVQSQGMRRWLTQGVADAFGAAASLALPFPASFMHDLARRLDGAQAAREGEDAFSRDALTWRVEMLLRTLPDEPRYQPLHRYLRGADALDTGLGGTDERVRFGLAERIASRLDDYQLYRADLLAAWEAGADTPGTTHALWQAGLWRLLCGAGINATPHAGVRLREAIRMLSTNVRPRGLPARVTVFGVSTLPPLFMEMLEALSRHLPVTVYTASLTADTPHPLAAAFGAQGREFIDALRMLGAEHTVLDEPAAATDSLLVQLQDELLRGAAGTTPLALDAADASLRVHSAHGNTRQLEIVRDQLLDALVADPTLRPHDLLLLVPDAGTWAPLVDAVFGVDDGDVPRIPFRIADRPARREDAASAALAMLLALQGGRLTHSELVELLAHPLVHETMGLAEGQVDRLMTLTHRANARWGYDAASRAAMGLPSYEAATWRATLDRLLLGLTTGRHDDLVLDLLPAIGDTIGDAAGLARLAEWVDAIAATLASWGSPRSLTEWVTSMRDAVALLFGEPGMRDAQAVAGVTALLERLRDLEGRAQYVGEVPFGVVRDWLDAELESESVGSGFLAGGMTVAALKPMRSLPFRVIAVVGLDEAVFPRRERRAAFDMLAADRRAGDRDLRSDDRQLFLDLLLAAGDRLVLAFSGRAVSDNSPCAPSVVLDELLDHLDRRSAGMARSTVLVEHPLQPFSRRYFVADRDPRLFTFSGAHARTATASLRARSADLPFVTAPIVPDASDGGGTFELTTRELADCWCNPSRFFCQQALGFTIGDVGDDASDDELLMPDALEQGSLRARLLASALPAGSDPARDMRRLQGSGDLPPGTLGEAWHALLRERVDAALTLVPGEPARRLPVSIAADEWRVNGTFDGVRGDARYVVRAGRFSAHHELRAWVEHVVMCAARECAAGDPALQASIPPISVLIGVERDKATVCERFGAVPDAMAVLTALVAHARIGRTMPLVFFPQAAVAWLKAHGTGKQRKNAAEKDPRHEALKAFAAESAFGSAPGDHADAHVALCFRGVDPLAERWREFEVLAQLVLGARLPAVAS